MKLIILFSLICSIAYSQTDPENPEYNLKGKVKQLDIFEFTYNKFKSKPTPADSILESRTSFYFDTLGRWIQKITYHDLYNYKETAHYNLAGQIISTSHQEIYKKKDTTINSVYVIDSLLYNSKNELIKLKKYKNGTIQLIDTTFKYDAFSHLVEERHYSKPNMVVVKVRNCEYDSLGNLKSDILLLKNNDAKLILNYFYNTLGNLSEIIFKQEKGVDGLQQYTYIGYDDFNNWLDRKITYDGRLFKKQTRSFIYY